MLLHTDNALFQNQFSIFGRKKKVDAGNSKPAQRQSGSDLYRFRP
jgi:hypothetical protein